ncbi:MAG: AAA family ATPase [Azoarcus sp.]|jgi:cellulose biosynthesis protein BcsQ|nr:AAA family ATPase [Azoarcus sp.]
MLSPEQLQRLMTDLESERVERTTSVDKMTSMFLDEDRLETLWPDGEHPETIHGAIQPILEGTGDIGKPHLEIFQDRLALIPGDLALSRFEDKLSDAWPRCLLGDSAAFRVTTAFYRLAHNGGKERGADIILIDAGPNLGAINRAALIASDQVVVPLGADMFSLQGLRNLGPTLREWRREWQMCLNQKPRNLALDMPRGTMEPVGYVVSQHGIRESRPVKSYRRWLARIPRTYRRSVLDENEENIPDPENDPHALAMLKHYRSLMPMAMDARKPMFSLRSADGAIGAHIEAVHACHEDFLNLAKKIADRTGISRRDE